MFGDSWVRVRETGREILFVQNACPIAFVWTGAVQLQTGEKGFAALRNHPNGGSCGQQSLDTYG